MSNVIHLAQRHVNGYLRPGRSSAARLKALIASGERPCDGLVLDAAAWSRLGDLSDAALTAGIETVLDPRSLELGSAGGRARGGVASLAWAGATPHDRDALRSADARAELVVPLADFVAAQRIDAVLAPTHYVEAPDDEWLNIDEALTTELREALDDLGCSDARVYRPLFIPSRLLSPRVALAADLATSLESRAIDAIWLGVHPFGASAGPLAVRRYIDFCRALHCANRPIVALHTGTVGLLLLAVGAVSAIESGVTDGEHFDHEALTTFPRPPRDGERIIGSTPRVYVQSLGAFLTTREAQALFAVRGMTAAHACQFRCCPRGTADMIGRRIDHFAIRRQAEIEALVRVPAHRRAKAWLDTELRPASDRAIAAERAHPRFKSVRKRLDDWRGVVSGLREADNREVPSVARPLTAKDDNAALRNAR